jgi:hypothetical protein
MVKRATSTPGLVHTSFEQVLVPAAYGHTLAGGTGRAVVVGYGQADCIGSTGCIGVRWILRC